jgi:hypothetical protein
MKARNIINCIALLALLSAFNPQLSEVGLGQSWNSVAGSLGEG